MEYKDLYKVRTIDGQTVIIDRLTIGIVEQTSPAICRIQLGNMKNIYLDGQLKEIVEGLRLYENSLVLNVK